MPGGIMWGWGGAPPGKRLGCMRNGQARGCVEGDCDGERCFVLLCEGVGLGLCRQLRWISEFNDRPAHPQGEAGSRPGAGAMAGAAGARRGQR